VANAQENRAGVPVNRHLMEIAIVFVAYVVAGKLGQATTNIRSSNLGPVWPAYGIALAGILICGYRVWPGVAAGAFLVALLSPVPAITAAGQAAAATLAALTGAFLLYRVANFDRSLSRLHDALWLIVLGALGSAVVSASLGVLVLYATHLRAYSGLGPAWLIYWLGDATGVLLVTPLALRFADFLKFGDRKRINELALLVLLVAITCAIIFGDLATIPVKLHVMAFAVLPFTIWAAIRFGVGVTALSIFIVAAMATIETALGSGPFASNTPFVNAVLLDVFFGVLAVTGLSLAAVIAERERAVREREQVVSRQAAMEAQLRADNALRESEARLRLALQAGKMYAFDWDVATDVVLRSEEFTNILGARGEPTSLTRRQFVARVHPDDRAKFLSASDNVTPDNPTGHASYRAFRKDGAVVWLEMHGRAFFDAQGKKLRMIGMVADVTERKQAEEALAGMSRKLIDAQEQERTRIARELHDDINQRLALLASEIEASKENPPDCAEGMSRILTEFWTRIVEVSSEVQSISHQLHSSQLEYLGIVAAMRSFCREVGTRQTMKIDFTHEEIPQSLPYELSLGLFRVLQEALHNAAKHSKARHLQVKLGYSANQLHLTVSDDGTGFDAEAATSKGGLGLISMRERVRLMNGTLLIESKPTGGTVVHVRVPFAREGILDRAVGE
jgi:PAS domain S-box-containing protein